MELASLPVRDGRYREKRKNPKNEKLWLSNGEHGDPSVQLELTLSCSSEIKANRALEVAASCEESVPSSSYSQYLRRCSNEEEDEQNRTRKKLRLSKEQACYLEESFQEHSTLNPKQKFLIAKRLDLRPRQVEVWFQNRRARTKLKQTEEDCEHLRQYCELLAEENRRLQKEIQELTALKYPQQHLRMGARATTLSLCPSCERAAASSACLPA